MTKCPYIPKRVIGKAINKLKNNPVQYPGIYWQDLTSGVLVVDNRYGQWCEIRFASDAYGRQYRKSEERMKALVNEYEPGKMSNYQISLFG